uniref:Rab-GAP TBC domain-containing protein n=2 Tax=Auxenochlorella protothecoides TaxID=3075 RepID=A0A1D2A759_AUXPR
MGRGRRKSGPQLSSPEAKRDAETVALINDILIEEPRDVIRLRKLVAVRGIPSHQLRTRVWPLLLGLPESLGLNSSVQESQEEQGDALTAAEKRDLQVIACDLDRSLWAFTEGWTEEARALKRLALRRVLLRALRYQDDVWYYQGLHDVASVLLFTLGEAGGAAVLSQLVVTHLRDATRPDLLAATQTLGLLYPLLRAADPQLYTHLLSLDEPALEVPFFALSWHLTWFAHDVADLNQVCRLFDLFLASHPLMPLYLAAVAVKSCRQAVFACGSDGPAVYAALKGLKVLSPSGPGADALARDAAALYRAVPPSALRYLDLGQAVTPDAYLVQGLWKVPAQPLDRTQGIKAARATILRLRATFLPQLRGSSPGARRKRRSAAVVAVLSSLTSIAALGAAILLIQGQRAWPGPV